MKTGKFIATLMLLLGLASYTKYEESKLLFEHEDLEVLEHKGDKVNYKLRDPTTYTPFSFSNNVIDKMLNDSVYLNENHIKQFKDEINFWYSVFTLDSMQTFVYEREGMKIIDTMKTIFPDLTQTMKKVDLAILDSIHKAHGYKRVPLLKKNRKFGIITGQKEKMEGAIKAGAPFFEYMIEKLEENNLPASLAAIPLFESRFMSKAHSWAKAKGYFQFREGTAKDHGLRIVNGYLDERKSLEHSLDAFIMYMKESYEKFGDKKLIALISYNTGRYHRYVRNHENKEEYEMIEKMGFAPRSYYSELVACIKVLENFETLYPDIELKKYNRKEIILEEKIQGKDAAKYFNISQEQFREYNHQFEDKMFKEDKGGYIKKGSRVFLPKN